MSEYPAKDFFTRLVLTNFLVLNKFSREILFCTLLYAFHGISAFILDFDVYSLECKYL